MAKAKKLMSSTSTSGIGVGSAITSAVGSLLNKNTTGNTTSTSPNTVQTNKPNIMQAQTANKTLTAPYSQSYVDNYNNLNSYLNKRNAAEDWNTSTGRRATFQVALPTYKSLGGNKYTYGAGSSGSIGSSGGYGSYSMPTYNYMDSISGFTPSSAYTQAMEYTNSLLEQLNSGRTSYTDKINDMMSQIENREKFSYDPDKDTLFQNYLNSAMNSGKQAMSDTMGQAASLTGGYGSTYATAAANGAYNNFIQEAYDNLPEYYNAALSTYESETNDLYNKLNMYNTADNNEYTRLYNAYGLNYSAAQDMYTKEYNNYWDTTNYNTSALQYNNSLNESMASYKNAAASAASSASAAKQVDYSKYYDLIDRAGQNYGYDSNQVDDIIANIANTYGVDPSFLISYASGGLKETPATAENTKPLVSNSRKYTAAEKNKKGTYVDEYGNEYSYYTLLNAGIIDKNGKQIK